MGMKTWALILIAAYAANQYLKKARQQHLETAATGDAPSGSSTEETRASRGKQALDADLPRGVERLRQTQPGGAFGGVASSRGDGNAHDDLLSPSPETSTPG